jgi:hypothetical protein
LRTKIRFTATCLVVTCGTLLIGCPGTVAPPDYDFLDRFPAGRKLCTKDRTQIIKSFRFDSAAAAGKVKVTFGDEEEQFEVPGSFAFTNMTKARSPSATLTITYQATEESKAQFRKLAARRTAKVRPDDKATWPAELPVTQTFSVLRGAKPADPLSTFELTDASGTRIELDLSQTVDANGSPVECDSPR